MPSYEYRCQDCRKRFEVFMTYAEYGAKTVACPHCGSSSVRRKIGRIRVARSTESRLETMGDAGTLEGLEDNPREMGRMMRKMKSEVGDDMGPMFDEVVGRLESGENPGDIDSSLGDMGMPGDEDF
jgi:putative FmdB family regulatory protein